MKLGEMFGKFSLIFKCLRHCRKNSIVYDSPILIQRLSRHFLWLFYAHEFQYCWGNIG